ncbi:MAG: hypothetical protein AB7E55_30615 [Pigmentiphaga sp.]
MELIGGLFAGLLGGGSAAGGAAAAGAGITGIGALQTGATLLSVVAGIGSGVAANNAAKAEAEEIKFQDREEFIQGKETSTALKEELMRTVSDQTVAFAAGGVDLSSVSAQTARRQAVDDAEKELSINSNQRLQRSLARRRQAANVRARGRAQLFSSVVGAGQTLANDVIDRSQLGSLS